MLLKIGSAMLAVAAMAALGVFVAVVSSDQARTTNADSASIAGAESLGRQSPDASGSTTEGSAQASPGSGSERASESTPNAGRSYESAPGAERSSEPGPGPMPLTKFDSESGPESSPEPGSSRAARSSQEPRSSQESDSSNPAGSPQTDNGPRATPEELEWVDTPRYYPPRDNAALTLTVERMGLYDMPVADSRSDRALDRGAIHVPETPMPWDERDQKNVYIAAHRLGVSGENSRLAFYNLDELEGGDRIVLKDKAGDAYRYEVTEVFEVNPEDVWVMDTVRDRDIVTLQTCTPIPTFEKRLVVRADRI